VLLGNVEKVHIGYSEGYLAKIYGEIVHRAFRNKFKREVLKIIPASILYLFLNRVTAKNT